MVVFNFSGDVSHGAIVLKIGLGINFQYGIRCFIRIMRIKYIYRARFEDSQIRGSAMFIAKLKPKFTTYNQVFSSKLRYEPGAKMKL